MSSFFSNQYIILALTFGVFYCARRLQQQHWLDFA